MIHKLTVYSPALSAKIRDLDLAQRQALRTIACTYAIRCAMIQDPNVSSALSRLNNGSLIDDSTVQHFEKLRQKWDAEAQEWHKQNPYKRITASLSFSKARALSALLAANGNDSYTATAEAVFEACRTLPDEQRLVKHLMTTLECDMN